MNREFLISLGISTLGTILVLFYLKNKINSVENKVDMMFQLIQNHENERKIANTIQVTETKGYNPVSNNDLIVVSDNDNLSDDEDSENDDDDDDNNSDSSEEVDDDDDKITLLGNNNAHNIQLKLDEIEETTLTRQNSVSEDVEKQVEQEQEKINNSEEEEQEDEEEEEEEEGEEEDEEDEDEEEEEEDEEEDDEKKIDYSKFKVSELKDFCSQKGLTKYGKLNKQKLIDLLNILLLYYILI